MTDKRINKQTSKDRPIELCLPFAAHRIVGDIESTWGLNCLLQVGDNLASHSDSVNRIQDRGARRVADVGADTAQPVRGGASIAFGSSRDWNLVF
jgi:hypothetical protein